MVASPQYGVMKFVGRRSGRTYDIDVYCSDVANALVTWSTGGAGASSTSPNSWRPVETVTLIDFAIVTGMTDTTKLQLLAGNQPTGDFVRFSLHLDSLANRSPMRLTFAAGVEIRAIQLA